MIKKIKIVAILLLTNALQGMEKENNNQINRSYIDQEIRLDIQTEFNNPGNLHFLKALDANLLDACKKNKFDTMPIGEQNKVLKIYNTIKNKEKNIPIGMASQKSNTQKHKKNYGVKYKEEKKICCCSSFGSKTGVLSSEKIIRLPKGKDFWNFINEKDEYQEKNYSFCGLIAETMDYQKIELPIDKKNQ